MEWEAQTGMCQWLKSTFENSCAELPGPAGVKGNDWADRLVGKATITGGLCLRRSGVLRSLRHYLQAQSQGHHTIDHAEERGRERGSAEWSSLKGQQRAIVSQMNIGSVLEADKGISDEHWNCFKGKIGELWTVSKATLGNLWETGWSTCGLFWAHRYHLELNWTEQLSVVNMCFWPKWYQKHLSCHYCWDSFLKY